MLISFRPIELRTCWKNRESRWHSGVGFCTRTVPRIPAPGSLRKPCKSCVLSALCGSATLLPRGRSSTRHQRKARRSTGSRRKGLGMNTCQTKPARTSSATPTRLGDWGGVCAEHPQGTGGVRWELADAMGPYCLLHLAATLESKHLTLRPPDA